MTAYHCWSITTCTSGRVFKMLLLYLKPYPVDSFYSRWLYLLEKDWWLYKMKHLYYNQQTGLLIIWETFIHLGLSEACMLGDFKNIANWFCREGMEWVQESQTGEKRNVPTENVKKQSIISSKLNANKYGTCEGNEDGRLVMWWVGLWNIVASTYHFAVNVAQQKATGTQWIFHAWQEYWGKVNDPKHRQWIC